MIENKNNENMSSSSMNKIRNICWSSTEKYSNYEETEKTWKILGEKKIHLIYGDCSVRLMGKVSKAAHVGGSEILVIIRTNLVNLIGATIWKRNESG